MARCYVQNNWDGTFTAVYQDDAGAYHVIPGGDRVSQGQAEAALNSYGPCGQSAPSPSGNGECGPPSKFGFDPSMDQFYIYCPGYGPGKGLQPLHPITDPTTIVGWQSGGPSGSSVCDAPGCTPYTEQLTAGQQPASPVPTTNQIGTWISQHTTLVVILAAVLLLSGGRRRR